MRSRRQASISIPTHQDHLNKTPVLLQKKGTRILHKKFTGVFESGKTYTGKRKHVKGMQSESDEGRSCTEIFLPEYWPDQPNPTPTKEKFYLIFFFLKCSSSRVLVRTWVHEGPRGHAGPKTSQTSHFDQLRKGVNKRRKKSTCWELNPGPIHA